MVKLFLNFSENSKREGERLKQEAENLPPILVQGTDLEITCEGLPTMLDGKVKSVWSGNDCCNKCYICHCGSAGRNAKLKHRHHPDFSVKNHAALRYGFSPLHVRMRAFDWFLKAKLNSDFQYHEAR